MGAGRDALNAAVARAWQVFDLPIPATTGVCVRCCMNAEIEKDFLNHAARDMPASYVQDWYFAAFAGDLGYAQMGWLLPRVLQMLADDEEVTNVGLEAVLARLPVAGFPDAWPAATVEPLLRFARAYLATCVEEGTDDLDAALCMIGESGLPIDSLLADLDQLDDDRLAGLLYRSWVAGGGYRITFSAFWSLEPSRTQAWNWYTSPVLYDRMIGAGMAGNPQAVAVAQVIGRTFD